MKIALVYDYIKEYGGAERVLEALHEMYPDAPVYTLIYAPQFLGPHRARFENWPIKPSFLTYLPFNYKFISVFRLIAPLVFKTFNFSGYDVIIVSATGAYSPNMINKQSAKQICYCHTPPRYLYGYATARLWKKHLFFRILGEFANHILRMVDFVSSKHVDIFIANSENIARRIKKFYRRESVVVYPPVVTISNFKFQISNSKKKCYLAGGRLARPKHFELVIQACMELKIPLKIFGKGFAGYDKELRAQSSKLKTKTKNSKLEFLGEITDEEKLELMREAKA